MFVCVLFFLFIKSEVLQSWRVQFDSPISTVLLFPLSCPSDPKEPSGEKSMLLLHHCFSLLQCNFFIDFSLRLFTVSAVEIQGYNLLVTSTIEMAVVYRSDFCYTSSLFLFLPLRQSKAVVDLCVFAVSEMSMSVVCLAPCASQRVISGMQCSVL